MSLWTGEFCVNKCCYFLTVRESTLFVCMKTVYINISRRTDMYTHIVKQRYFGVGLCVYVWPIRLSFFEWHFYRVEIFERSSLPLSVSWLSHFPNVAVFFDKLVISGQWKVDVMSLAQINAHHASLKYVDISRLSDQRLYLESPPSCFFLLFWLNFSFLFIHLL